MKKKALTPLVILLIALLAISCQGESSSATLRVVLDSSITERVIVPDDFPLDVVKYRISGSGPGEQTFSITTSRSSATLEGLQIGEWKLQATGMNEENVPIVEGSTTFTLTQNNTSATIRLDSLIGEGNLEVLITWDRDRVSEPELEIELTKQGEDMSEKSELEVDVGNARATYQRTGLESGSYILQGRLYSQGELAAGFTEAVRIVDDKTSEKEIELILSEFPSSPGTLQLLNDSGVPVLCSITGLEEQVESGKSVTVTLEPNNTTLKDFTVKWYLDGNYIDEGESISFETDSGQHRLDAVAYTDKIGSYGSTGITFEAYDNTAVGIPGNRVKVSEEKGISLGRDTLIHYLPDGKFLIFNGQDQSLQLCENTSSSVRVVESYGSGRIDALGNTPVVASSQIMDDEGNVAILLSTTDALDTVHLNYNTSTGEVTQIQNSGDLMESISDKRFTRLLPYSFYDSKIERFVLFASDSNNHIYTLERDASSLSPDPEYFPYVGYDFTMASSLYSETFYGPAAIVISPDEKSYVILAESGEMFRFDSSTYPQKSVQFKMKNIEESSFSNASDMVAADNVVVIGGSGYLGSFDPYMDTRKNILSLEYDVLDLEAGKGEKPYVYAIGSDEAIHIFSLGNTGTISELTKLSLDGSYDSIALSSDGTKLVAYSSEGGDDIVLYRINTR